ncbi:MAG: recombinase family protein [Patescibacteria group bacterium]|jgi:DNA invertase Pin-like site-specific DNA recombinase|nr:recombinase family protein [Patescibacteria group bacterium]
MENAITPEQKIKYCLYARKSTESEERQVLSIDSQVKEMLDIAVRENLDIVEIKRESHSAKDTGQREIFNELLGDIRTGRFNGIITWAPDRLSRNAGDLGAIVDLMDQGLLAEIRTHGQTFTNNPNEKFMLMILGSTAKLENDHRGENVKRGMRTRVEMGLWPGMAPLGYLNQNQMDKKCQIIVDPLRAPIIKQIFEKVANERWSGRKIYNWLKFDLNFKTRGQKTLALSGIYNLLRNPFYYGMFEYPKNSGKWYQGKHKPIITQKLFDQAQVNIKTIEATCGAKNKEFAFTKLMVCGLCGSSITGQEKFKKLTDGTTAKYIYYGCTRAKNPECKNTYIREESLINELAKTIDKVEIDQLGVQGKFEDEVRRLNNLQTSVLGGSHNKIETKKIDIRAYAKYLIQNGNISEKRELLSLLKSKLIYTNKKIRLLGN